MAQTRRACMIPTCMLALSARLQLQQARAGIVGWFWLVLACLLAVAHELWCQLPCLRPRGRIVLCQPPPRRAGTSVAASTALYTCSYRPCEPPALVICNLKLNCGTMSLPPLYQPAFPSSYSLQVHVIRCPYRAALVSQGDVVRSVRDTPAR